MYQYSKILHISVYKFFEKQSVGKKYLSWKLSVNIYILIKTYSWNIYDFQKICLDLQVFSCISHIYKMIFYIYFIYFICSKLALNSSKHCQFIKIIKHTCTSRGKICHRKNKLVYTSLHYKYRWFMKSFGYASLFKTVE